MHFIDPGQQLKKIIDGGLSVLSKVRSVPKAYAVLLYHRITNDPIRAAGLEGDMFIHTEDFEKQMQNILDIGTPIPLKNMVERIKQKKVPNKLYIAITFDDGYEDVIRLGLPILEKYSIPATLFVATGFIDDQTLIPWWDRLTQVSEACRQISFEYGGQSYNYDCSQINKFTIDMSRFIKYKNSDIINALEKAVKAPRPAKNEFADWMTLKKAANGNLLSIGGHTINHPVLSRSGLDEIESGKKRLEDELDAEVNIFAYPFGERIDISDDVVRASKLAGYEAAVTTISGYNFPREDLYRLRRIKCVGRLPISHFNTNLMTGDVKRYINNLFNFLNRS